MSMHRNSFQTSKICSLHCHKGVLISQGKPCVSNPCQNGGSCYGEETGFTCVCTAEYTGMFCGQVCGVTLAVHLYQYLAFPNLSFVIDLWAGIHERA